MTRTVTVEAKPANAPRDCAALGHHNHEPDGTVYIRHDGRPEGEKVTVSCCFCGATAEGMPVFSRRTSAPSEAAYSRASCGDALAAPSEKELATVYGVFNYQSKDDGWGDVFRVVDDDGMPFVLAQLARFEGKAVRITVEVLHPTTGGRDGTT